MIFCTGYSDHRAAALSALATARNLCVVDVRMSPMSRIPGWELVSLSELMTDRYKWVQSLGNINYRDHTKPIVIANPARGLEIVLGLLRRFDGVIILCGCRDASKCHRSVIAALLEARGYATAELDWSEVEAETEEKLVKVGPQLVMF